MIGGLQSQSNLHTSHDQKNTRGCKVTGNSGDFRIVINKYFVYYTNNYTHYVTHVYQAIKLNTRNYNLHMYPFQRYSWAHPLTRKSLSWFEINPILTKLC